MRNALFPWLVIVLLSTLVLGLALMPQTASPAQAADATLVFATEQAIMDNRVERPDAIKLLTGALTGLRQALTKVGIAERLADLTAADETSARAEFQARFDRAIVLGQGKLTAKQLQYAAADAMAASLGDGEATRFRTPEQWANRNGFVGTGIDIWNKLGRLFIFRVFPYTPAASAGLRPFDRILAIDGQSVQEMMKKGMTTRDIADHIRGPEGTTVNLTVRRPGQSAPLLFSIVRQRVQSHDLEHKILGGHVGYIYISFLIGADTAEFRRALVDLQHTGMRELIVDLRTYTSVFFGASLRVANTLLPAGVPIHTILAHMENVSRHARPVVCRAPLSNGGPSPKSCTDITEGGTLLDPSTPLIVLIDEQTSNTGETLSAAIRATRRGRLLGVRTAGHVGWSGLVPNADPVDLPGGAKLFVKTRLVLAGDGTVLDRIGVQPDVVVELTAQDLDRGVDTQLQRAVQMLAR